MKKNRRVLQNLKKKDDAVAGIIVAILLVGLIISVLAIIQTVYVPRWMEQKEAEHMHTVLDQFSLLKFAIDTQAISGSSDISLSTSITLGSKEWPIFSSSRAYGTLEIIEEGTEFKIMDTGGTQLLTSTFGIIKYSSSNAYYLDKTYVYETGALISSQSDGNVMSIVPNFFVKYEEITGFSSVDLNLSIITKIPIKIHIQM
jgi:cell division protein FtsL